MILLRLCRNVLLRPLIVLVIISSLSAPAAFCQETEDSQIFIAGFNAYQRQDYTASIEKMNEVLQKHPDTPLRDMALFWLSRSYYKAGNLQEAARCLSQFSREFPDNPLKSTAEDELLALAARYDKGEQLPTGPVDTGQARLSGHAAAIEEAGQQQAVAEKTGPDQSAAAASKTPEQTNAAAEPALPAVQGITGEKAKTARMVYREKAISQYKNVIDTFPGSSAAATAADKLRELGVVVALPPQAVEAPLPENAQVLRLEVAQFAALEFNLLASPDVSAAGQPVTVPFEIINRGNGTDSFVLESAFPADFKARFVSPAAPDMTISQTPAIAPGESFKGSVNLVIPPASIDGLRIVHPVKATSSLMPAASQSREVRLTASAPLLRAVLRTEKSMPLPGDTVPYHITLLNVGSAAAGDVTFRLNFPPQLEPVDPAAAGFTQEMDSALVLNGLQLRSGEGREFSVAFRLRQDSLAGQEVLTRAELVNARLGTAASFVSNIVSIGSRRSVSVHAGSNRLVVIPGQTVTIPFIVTNTGNILQKFRIRSAVTGIRDAVVYHDLNRDGNRQTGEPAIEEIGPLAPGEEAGIVMEIKTPASASDTSQTSAQLSLVSENDAACSAMDSTLLSYSRPVLKMVMTGGNGRLKPGDIASFDLTITNDGSNLSRIVELQSVWPEQLELIAAAPETSTVTNGTVIWHFKELGAGEKRNIRVSFRVKPGIGVGTAIRVKNILSYEDQLGNRY